MSLKDPKVSIFLTEVETDFWVDSEVADVAHEELPDPTKQAPLFFLKIEGDKHFFPPSYSLISYSLSLFFASFSRGSPLLH